MSTPSIFGRDIFCQLSEAARASPRLRKNLDFHATPSHPANRLLNAMEPGSYVRPHRHLEAQKDETLVTVHGTFGLLTFDELGQITAKAVLRAGGELIGCNIPIGIFHCLVSLEQGSVFFEAKAGPYNPATDKEWAPWAPAEGDPAAITYLASLKQLFT